MRKFARMVLDIDFTKGDFGMNENELELLRMIRENDDPGQAAVTAIETIVEHLMQHGSCQEQAAAGL